MQDIFDIVDERDRVVGQAPRGRVHREQLLHRAIHVLLFNPRGEVFIQKRSLLKDSAPGCWDSSCSGHVDAGESYLTAARRELGEELGLVPSPLFWPVMKVDARAETGWEFVWVYRGIGVGPFVLNPEEITDGRWIAPGRLLREIQTEPERFARCFRFIMDRFL